MPFKKWKLKNKWDGCVCVRGGVCVCGVGVLAQRQNGLIDGGMDERTRVSVKRRASGIAFGVIGVDPLDFLPTNRPFRGHRGGARVCP